MFEVSICVDSIMHICLLPIEILTDIVFAVIYEVGFQKKESLRTFAALARTCRRFKEPALNTLWKDMVGFTPLILCLPEDVRGRTTVKGRSRILRVSQMFQIWTHVMEYSDST